MKHTLVDTSHWVGAFTKKDKFKEEGKKFLDWFDKQDKNNSRIITTYSVLTEVVAWLINKDYFEKAEEVLDFITSNPKIDVYNDSKELKDSIFKIFKQYKGLSLVDSELVVIYKNLRCDQLLTTDGRIGHCSGVHVFKEPH